MNLLKTSALNAVAVAVKMLTLLGLNKVLAVYVGPTGYAAIGQLQNAIQMITTFSSGAINTGVVRYTAEYRDDEVAQQAVWRTAGGISLIGTAVAAVLVVLLSERLAVAFINNAQYANVFLWFAGSLVFFVFNALLLAAINGKKEIVTYVLANIGGSLLSLLVVSVVTANFGLEGALISLAIYQSLSFFVTLGLCSRLKWFSIKFFFGPIKPDVAKRLFKYTIMAVFSALCMPLSQMLVRSDIGSTLGWDAAGYWEAMWRLSSAYLMFITTTLGVYYLPRLAELNRAEDIRKEIFLGYKLIIPVVACFSFCMYLGRDWIVALLFSAQFAPVTDLFAYQLVGDVLKIASWIMGYILTAKAYVGMFILSEVLFSLCFVGLAFLLIRMYGLEGASMAYALTYVIHFAFMVCVMKYKRVV